MKEVRAMILNLSTMTVLAFDSGTCFYPLIYDRDDFSALDIMPFTKPYSS